MVSINEADVSDILVGLVIKGKKSHTSDLVHQEKRAEVGQYSNH